MRKSSATTSLMTKAKILNGLPAILVINRGLIYNNGKFLFLKRTSTDSLDPGLWELPGGKLDVGETLEENLLREVKEETNLSPKLIKPAVKIIDEFSRVKKYEGYYRIEVTNLLISKTQKIKISDEHDEYKWKSLSEAKITLNLSIDTLKIIDDLHKDIHFKDLLKEANVESLPNI